jgi:hypothetical protein
VPSLLGLSVMLPALFGIVASTIRMPWPTPPASLDWAWACLRSLARSCCFCVRAASETVNESHGIGLTKRRASGSCTFGDGCARPDDEP